MKLNRLIAGGFLAAALLGGCAANDKCSDEGAEAKKGESCCQEGAGAEKAGACCSRAPRPRRPRRAPRPSNEAI
jgi:hypothetical protein